MMFNPISLERRSAAFAFERFLRQGIAPRLQVESPFTDTGIKIVNL